MVVGFRLPDSLRGELAKPHGKLYRGSGTKLLEEIEEVKSCRLFCCVGDLVTASAIKLGMVPDIAVVDGKTLREEKIDFSYHHFEARLEAENPPACITCEMISTLRNAVEIAESGGKVLVFIIGEEDLAVMPLGLLLPEGSLIIYGQPGEGVVALVVDREKKLLILSLLRKMERIGECKEMEQLMEVV